MLSERDIPYTESEDNMGDIIDLSFKEVADNIDKLIETYNFEHMSEKDVENFAENIFANLDFSVSNPPTNEELYAELTDIYRKLIRFAGVNKFSWFKFKDYEDSRVVLVDGNELDFDIIVSHNDENETEMLCEIDCLISDLCCEEKTILKNIERIINTK